MQTKPAIPLEHIRRHLQRHYHARIDTLEFLPIGEGAWCFRTIGDPDLFIRLVKDPPAEITPAVLHFLHDAGLPVVQALPDSSGNFVSGIETYGVIVYPFIPGTSMMKRSLPESDVSRLRREIGAITARLHRISTVDVDRFHLPREDFSKFQAEIMNILQKISQPHHDPLLKDFSYFLKRWQNEVEDLIGNTQELGQYLRSQQLDHVLCHGDIHEDNVLLSDEGELFIIDWDGVLLAPRERDLMFFAGSGLADYLEGYRRYEADYKINQLLVDYYILEWALQEIVDYGTRSLFDDRFDIPGRLDAWQQFQALFEPGGDVDRALTLMNSILNNS